MEKLAELYAEEIIQRFSTLPQNLYGPAYKGIPLAVAISMALEKKSSQKITFTFNRKEAKDHGEGGLLVGNQYILPENVLMVEDVITAGTSFRESVKILKQFPQANLCGLLVAVDRMETLEDNLSAMQWVEKEFSIPAYSLINAFDVQDYLHHKDHRDKWSLEDFIVDEMDAYLNKYGIKR